jgi:hypothetical protein
VSIRFRENWDYRYLDFAFPSAAREAIFDIEMKAINDGIATRSVQSGPLMIDFPKCSGTMLHRIMMVDSKHAEAFIAEIEAACEPFTVTASEFGKYGADD